MEQSKTAKSKKQKFPCLQDCFSVGNYAAEKYSIIFNPNKATKEIIEFFKLSDTEVKNNFKRTLLIYNESPTGNCQLSSIILSSVSGTLNEMAKDLSTDFPKKRVFETVDKKRYLHIVNEAMKFFNNTIKKGGHFRNKPLILMDIKEDIYAQISTMFDMKPAKVNTPYKSTNGSNMRILVLPLSVFETKIL